MQQGIALLNPPPDMPDRSPGLHLINAKFCLFHEQQRHPHPDTSPHPVSYTHLDVYKRQAYPLEIRASVLISERRSI